MEEISMKARLTNPAYLIPEAMDAIKILIGATHKGSVSPKTLSLIHQRISQINGCGVCIDGGWRQAQKSGETHERLYAVAAWRDTPYFSEAERAALALAEAVTRIADKTNPVPDEIWNEAAKHYDERSLATLVLHISVVNVFNRINVATGQIASGEWKS
jgi:AhpD family alkylhydroperoxidase